MEEAPRYTLLTLFKLFKVLKQYHVSLYILLGKVRTLLETAIELLSILWGECMNG